MISKIVELRLDEPSDFVKKIPLWLRERTDHDGWSIHRIDLDTEASVSDIATAAFEEHAQSAKKKCPVSRALSGVEFIC